VDIKQFVADKAKSAKAASRKLANLSTEIKNNALFKMAAGLEADSGRLMTENKKDLAAAEQKGLSKAMIDRLALNACLIRSARCSKCGAGRTACRWAGCGCPSG